MKLKCFCLASLAIAGYALMSAGGLTSPVDRTVAAQTTSPFGDPLVDTALQDDNKGTAPARDPQVDEEIRKAVSEYAKALQQLAEADLEKANEANRRVPETIPNTVVRSLQDAVAVAEARVKLLSGEKTDQTQNPYELAANDAIRSAQQNLDQALKANARAPGAVSEGEVKRRRAQVAIAEARAAVAKHLPNASPMEVARWEILQLQEAVNDLQNRVQLLQYRN